jgi:hypothetical protein
MNNGDILAYYDEIWKKMTEYKPEKRLTAVEVHDMLTQVINRTYCIKVPSPTKASKPVLQDERKSTQAETKHEGESVIQRNEKALNDGSKDISVKENEGEVTVYLVGTAKHARNQSGGSRSYHYSNTCGYLRGTIIAISEKEALEYLNQPCKSCAKQMSPNPKQKLQEFTNVMIVSNAKEISNSSNFPKTVATVSDIAEDKTKSVTVDGSKTVVYLAKTSASRENPKGKTNAKYHVSETCVATAIAVPIEEAISFRHSPCGRCSKRMMVEEHEMNEVIRKMEATDIIQ